MKLVDYGLAEGLSARLARQLRRDLGEEISEARFVAIPRGGFLVLGMLSYILGLEKSQMGTFEGERSDLIVVVDDCALSGARFASTLEHVHSPRIVFAHLLSHPELRRAILEQEQRVEACLAASDLAERSDFNPDPGLWEKWRQRLPGKRYWLGAVEHVSFPWSEPSLVLWNERTQRIEDQWHSASPRHCLKSRAALGVPFPDTPVGPLDVPQHLRWKIQNDEVVAWHVHDDMVFGLRGMAGAMWRALAAYGDTDAAAEYLLRFYDVDEATLRSDLDSFRDELLAKGLLQRLYEPDDTTS